MTPQNNEISIISSSVPNKQDTEHDRMEFSAALEETSEYMNNEHT